MIIGTPWSRIKFFSLGDLMLPLEDNEIRFLLANDDMVEVAYEHQRIALNQGDFLILNADSTRVVEQKTGAMLISLFADNSVLKDAAFGSQLSHRVEGCSAIDHTREDEVIADSLMMLIKMRLRPQDYREADILKHYYQILSQVLAHYVTDHGEEAEHLARIGGQAQKAYEIRNYIDANYKKPITLDFVANKFYFSSPYLSRLFKKIFDQSFHKYITALRIQSAQSDMMNTNNSITDIALDNGFPNVGAFNTAFKQQYQVTPGKYRKANKDRLAQERAAREFVEPKQQMNKLVAYVDSQHNQLVNLQFRNVFANAQGATPLDMSWRRLINIGAAEALMTNEMDMQVARVQQEIHFTYGRVWALFTDNMLMADTVHHTYSFTKIDNALEMMISKGLTPFLELGAKPLNILANSSERLRSDNPYEFVTQPHFDFPEFLTGFVRHCIAKWGKAAVSQWQFEYWYPSAGVEADQYLPEQDPDRIGTYLKQFAAIKQAIKAEAPQAQVGGCGLSVDLDYNSAQTIIKQWQRLVAPDFFSISIYPQNYDANSDDFKVENSTSSDPNKMADMITSVQALLDQENWGHMPLYVTEWNLSISDRNAVNDSLFKAAYIVRNVLQCSPLVSMLGYWQLSDVFGTTGSIKTILHGGSGLLTRDNLRKPAFFAFKLLNSMSGEVRETQEHVLITSDGYDRVNVLVLNYKHFNSVYYFSKENAVAPEQINKIFENTTPFKGSAAIDGVIPGQYLMKEWRLDPEHGDLLKRFVDWGQLTDLGNDEIHYLRQNIAPELSVKHVTVKDNLHLDFDLAANAMVVFELYRIP